MKLREIVESQDAFVKLMNQDVKASVALRIHKLGKQVADELNGYNKVRNSLIEKYGEKNEDGNAEIKENDKKAMEKFRKELGELLETDVELKFQKFNSGQFSKCEIKPVEIGMLEWMFE